MAQRVKYTKIIATLGPACGHEDGIRSLIRAGADCFRLNFSHGDGESMMPLIEIVRRVSRQEGARIAILADIQGPKLRIGRLAEEGVRLVEGNEFVITTRDIETGDEGIVHSSYAKLPLDVRAGARLLLADGTIELQVQRIVDETDVVTKVVRGGQLFSNRA